MPVNELGHVGPFTFTGEVSLTGLATLVGLLILGIRLVRHMTRVDDRVEALWKSIMGTGPQDPKSFFVRFALMEYRVGQIWTKLGFERRLYPREEEK